MRTDVADPGIRSRPALRAPPSDAFGGIDVLVNNAALYGDWDMLDQSYAYLKRMFDVNLHGVWLMSRAVAPHMAARGRGPDHQPGLGHAYNYSRSAARRGWADALFVLQLLADQVGRGRVSPSSWRAQLGHHGASRSTASRPA